MKKEISVFLILVLAMSLAACGSGKDAGNSSNSTETDASVQTAQEESGTMQDAEKPAPSSDMQEQQQSDGALVEDGEGTETEGAEMKALVVYFSVTGNTKAVAETLAGQQGADIFEIVPKQPYTDEDLNYTDSTTRATVEQNDPEARPAIQGSITDFAQYDIVYVGYPIWWGDMPRILYTFFDTYDFSGKTIAPFCTSGGSGLSGTPKTIAGLETGAEVLDGLSVGSSQANQFDDVVADWLSGLGLAEE